MSCENERPFSVPQFGNTGALMGKPVFGPRQHGSPPRF
jgi:hypothetical protein